MMFLGLNNFLRNYSILPRTLNKILWKSFLVNRRERFNAISETKSNTVHLKYTTLLSLQQQSQDLSLLLLQGLDCLTLLSLNLLILYNELVMLSFPSFPFIVLFLQVFWSKFAILFKFFSKKTNHFLCKPSTLFLFTVSLVSYIFMFLQIFPLLFFLISWVLLFSFSISDGLFWVSASVLRSLSSNLFVRSSRSCYLWLLSCFWLVPFHEGSKMISKTSHRYCKFFADV